MRRGCLLSHQAWHICGRRNPESYSFASSIGSWNYGSCLGPCGVWCRSKCPRPQQHDSVRTGKGFWHLKYRNVEQLLLQYSFWDVYAGKWWSDCVNESDSRKRLQQDVVSVDVWVQGSEDVINDRRAWEHFIGDEELSRYLSCFNFHFNFFLPPHHNVAARVTTFSCLKIASWILCQCPPFPCYPTHTISHSHCLLGRCLYATSTFTSFSALKELRLHVARMIWCLHCQWAYSHMVSSLSSAIHITSFHYLFHWWLGSLKASVMQP